MLAHVQLPGLHLLTKNRTVEEFGLYSIQVSFQLW